MSEIDSIFSSYIQSDPSSFHAAVFRAADKDGNILHASSHGNTRVDGTGQTVSEDSIFWTASMGKLFTAVAVMVVVERGLISLEDDVGEVVDALKGLEILKGFGDDGKPILQKAEKKLTLRNLLTHTSGLAYDVVSENLRKWDAYHGRDPSKLQGTYEQYRYPLIFEPGEDWAYGPGIDWAGRVVETLTNQTLESFMSTAIFSKLNLTSTTFHPATIPTYPSRAVELAARSPSTPSTLSAIPTPYPNPARDCLGGIGLYSTARDYTTLLSTLLAGGGSVLRPESVDQLFKTQLDDDGPMNRIFSKPVGQMNRMLTAGKVVSMGLSVCVCLDEVPGGRRAGSVSWGGYTNTFWWLDREAGVCGTLFFQLLPPVDGVVIEILDKVEAVVYKGLEG
ncbi:hypothetical protein FQN53_006387 [Emmonsiellopsis sp. PD_33]|nr:hypothetical protein FQN53_006387 [Emmonsiellopsis sp. PD_33]KAK2801306.1 hypothetical protein FQN51_005406 [Onygenales sp. PD_10]